MTENLSKISEEFTRWKEVIGLSLVAFLGVIFRLGRAEQRREDRIAELERGRLLTDERIEQMAEDLADIKITQAEQGTAIKHIADNVGQLRQDWRELRAAARRGGNRWYDPPGDD